MLKINKQLVGMGDSVNLFAAALAYRNAREDSFRRFSGDLKAFEDADLQALDLLDAFWALAKRINIVCKEEFGEYLFAKDESLQTRAGRSALAKLIVDEFSNSETIKKVC